MPENCHFQFPSDVRIVSKCCDKVLKYLEDMNLSEAQSHDLKLVFTEAFVNAVKYGNKSNPDLTVDVKVTKAEDHIELVIDDQGKGFDYKSLYDCTDEENLTKKHGRGVFLIKQLMDQVIYEENGSIVRMIKYINKKINEDLT